MVAFFTDGTFELEDDEGQPVDVEDAVGDPVLAIAAGDFELVDDFEDVVAVALGLVGPFVIGDDNWQTEPVEVASGRLAEGDKVAVVDELDVEVFLAAVFALEQEAIGDQLHDRFVAFVEVGGGKGVELADDGVDFDGGDPVSGVLLRQKGA